MQSRSRESSLVIFLKAFPPQIVGVMVAQIAIVNGMMMIGAVFVGMVLDRQFGTRPLLTIVLPLIAALLSVFVAYRLALRTVTKSRKAYLDWAEAEKAANAAPASDPSAPQRAVPTLTDAS
jgi:ABC-type protease/lipase transport system fused ATPase/permease subunit